MHKMKTKLYNNTEMMYGFFIFFLNSRMGFPVNAVVKPAETHTGGTSPLESAPAPSTDHSRAHPDLWR